jgi:hypothetical protein
MDPCGPRTVFQPFLIHSSAGKTLQEILFLFRVFHVRANSCDLSLGLAVALRSNPFGLAVAQESTIDSKLPKDVPGNSE